MTHLSTNRRHNILKHLKPHSIETIIALTERLRAKYPREDGKLCFLSDLTKNRVRVEDDVTHHALVQLLSALNVRARAELKALMWLGRVKWTPEIGPKVKV